MLRLQEALYLHLVILDKLQRRLLVLLFLYARL
jgi:hypothetical protein